MIMSVSVVMTTIVITVTLLMITHAVHACVSCILLCLLNENEYSMRLEHQIHRITVSLTTTGLRIVVLCPRVSAFQPVLLKSRSGS